MAVEYYAYRSTRTHDGGVFWRNQYGNNPDIL